MTDLHVPEQPLPRKYLRSILFLAHRMAEADGAAVPRERRMIEILAEAVDMRDFRRDRDYNLLNDSKACSMLDLAAAKDAALVVISLIMKADFENKEQERAYFSKIRALLGCGPITVPTDLQAHKKLALKFLA